MRPEKESMYTEIKDRIDESVFLILTDYGGLDVSTGQALRSALREVDAEFHVIKNRSFRYVAKDVGVDELEDGLRGPTAMVTGSGEVAEVAKVLKRLSRSANCPWSRWAPCRVFS